MRPVFGGSASTRSAEVGSRYSADELRRDAHATRRVAIRAPRGRRDRRRRRILNALIDDDALLGERICGRDRTIERLRVRLQMVDVRRADEHAADVWLRSRMAEECSRIEPARAVGNA